MEEALMLTRAASCPVTRSHALRAQALAWLPGEGVVRRPGRLSAIA
jgi:hypothetical protein